MTENGTSRERWPEPLPAPPTETFTFDEGWIEFSFVNTGELIEVHAQFIYPAGLSVGPVRKVAEFDTADEATQWVYSLDGPGFTWQQAILAFDEAAALFDPKIREAAEQRANTRAAYAAHYREHPEDLGEHNPYL